MGGPCRPRRCRPRGLGAAEFPIDEIWQLLRPKKIMKKNNEKNKRVSDLKSQGVK
jgi:hypothetical protein